MVREIVDAAPVRARLRAATVALHRALEARIDLLSPQLSEERYRRLLVGFHGYFSAIEPRLVALARKCATTLPVILRAGLLERDLVWLVVSAKTIAEGPRCRELPVLREREQLAGCLYVLEGSRLGGKVIARAVEARLGFSSERGCAFFFGNGEPPGRWPEVLSFIERLACEASVDVRKILSSAVETFASLERWLATVGALA